jgi:hypothetical protein
MSIYQHTFNGVPVTTGDIICTRNGAPAGIVGAMWQAIGRLVPGEIDHCAIYIGPDGRCIESGARGVITFDMPDERWDSPRMNETRWLMDSFHGVAYPLAGRGIARDQEAAIRADVAAFCLEQAASGKPYNPIFFASSLEAAFYCSQLIYVAYRRHGIDLNSGRGAPKIAVADSIVFPQEIWESCHRVRRYAP